MEADLPGTSALTGHEEMYGTDVAWSLSAAGLVVRYGGVDAVRGVSFALRPGEVVGLIGPNGAGKSSVIGALAGQLRANAGRVMLNGRDISRMSPHHRARLGLARTFQSASVFDRMTVFENLTTAGRGVRGSSLGHLLLSPRSNRRAERVVFTEAWKMLDRFQLGGMANSRPGELSGGQRRLVEIMTCLMRRPSVILLDEPMVGVASHLVTRLMADLRAVAAEGVCLLVVEHSLEVISLLCDRVIVMAQGEVISAGSYQAVTADPVVRQAYLD